VGIEGRMKDTYKMGEIRIDTRLVETCSCPTNIACIKYWGKKSVELNTPINSSVSVTLSQSDLRTETSVCATTGLDTHQLWLNGKREEFEKNKRFKVCLEQVRALAQDRIDPVTGNVVVRKEDWMKYKILVVSRNTFPTAAGLASSAAGLACLVFSLAKLFNAREQYDGQFSAIARQGSGSACRSLYGGFVRWQMGSQADGLDSHAIQVADENHWPSLCMLIFVVSEDKKDTSSTAGMGTSVATSPLLAFRASHVVEERLHAIEQAYLNRNFPTFGKLTMQDSNQFHATCLDTFPPIFYMNDISRSIIRCVHQFNTFHTIIKAAYTFDAGPNAVVYLEKSSLQDFTDFMLYCYPPSQEQKPSYIKGPLKLTPKPANVPGKLKNSCIVQNPGSLRMIYYAEVGGGPQVLPPSSCLIDLSTGCPKSEAHCKAADDSTGTTAKEAKKATSVGMLGMFGMLIISAVFLHSRLKRGKN